MWWLEVKGEGKGEEGNGDRDKGERPEHGTLTNPVRNSRVAKNEQPARLGNPHLERITMVSSAYPSVPSLISSAEQ
jgi:hypothetical protein